MKFGLLVIVVLSQKLYIFAKKEDLIRQRRTESEDFRKDLLSLLTKFDVLSRSRKSEQHSAEANGLSATAKIENDEKDDMDDRILKGFENEKMFLRKTLDTMKASQSSLRQDIKESINEMKDVVSHTVNKSSGQINIIETSLNSTIMQFEARIMDELDKKIETLKNDTERRLDSIEEKFKPSNDKVRNIESRLPIATDESECDDADWERYDSSCYLFGKRQLSWDDAKQACEVLNAHLVEIQSEAENEYLLSKWKEDEMTDTFQGAWIGLSGRNWDDFIWDTSRRKLRDTDYRPSIFRRTWGIFRYSCVRLLPMSSAWKADGCTKHFTYTCEKHIGIHV